MPTIDTFVADNLIAGDFPIVTKPVTVLSGQNLVRGSVVGVVTASGKVILSLSGAADGSQTPYAVLAADVDASTGDKPGIVYLTGEFEGDELTLGTGHTLASIEAGLEAKNIYLR